MPLPIISRLTEIRVLNKPFRCNQWSTGG